MSRCCAYSFLLSLFILLGGCDEDGIIGTGIRVEGSAQKGPFVVRSTVLVNRLTASGDATDRTMPLTTINDLGDFSFNGEAGLYQIIIDGYHFNEITGTVSDGPLQLRAISRIGKHRQRTFVNLLTHLIYPRVYTKIKNGMEAQQAFLSARSEFLLALSALLPLDTMAGETIDAFDRLSVYDFDGTDPLGNAYLLALSAMLYQHAENLARDEKTSSSGKLTELINTMSQTFGDTGTADTALLQRLRLASRQLNPGLIEQHLQEKSLAVAAEKFPVPDINLFIDTDGDGQYNNLDPDDDNDGLPDVSDPNPYVPDNIKINLIAPPQPVTEAVVLNANADIDTNIRYFIDGFPIGSTTGPSHALVWNPYLWSGKSVQLTATFAHQTGVYLPVAQSLALDVSPLADNALLRIPADGDIMVATSGTVLRWDAVHETGGAEIRVRRDAATEYLIQQQSLNREFELPPLIDGVYHWQVRVTGGDGRGGGWTPEQSFKLINDPGAYLDLRMLDIQARNSDQTTTFPRNTVTASVSYSIKNAGNSRTQNAFQIHYYISQLKETDFQPGNSAYYPVGSDLFQGELGANETVTFNKQILRVNGEIPPGQYYLIAIVDAVWNIDEIDDPVNSLAYPVNNRLLGHLITIE